MKKIYSIVILSIFLLVGCSNQGISAPLTKTDFYFDTVVTITLYDSTDESIIDDCFSLCQKYEELFSKTIATSDIAILNRDKQLLNANPDTVDILTTAQKYSALTDGKFDVTVSNLRDLWNFTGDNPHVPDDADIQNYLAGVNYNNLVINETTISITNSNTSVDLGAIAKGYIADKLKEFLISKNVKSAIVDLGGNIVMVGSKNNQPFTIGIQKPFEDRNETLATIQGKDLSIVTSGSYERFFYEDGLLYHHILDTTTGYPCYTGLASVTILSDKSVDGDALSTSCFALGLEDGLVLIESLDDIEAVFVDENNKITLSSGLTMSNDNVITYSTN